MIDQKIWYSKYREKFGSVTQATVDTLQALFIVFDNEGYIDCKREKLAYMLATIRAECGPALTPITENMNYSAKRICQVWPSRFKTVASAEPYAHNPQALANNVYANRLGNGNAASGDGYRYRGRGIGAQFTGRECYARFSKLFNVDLINNPELALDLDLGARILYTGSTQGLFTGKKLGDYIKPSSVDYINARRVINADVQRMGARIANDAKKFEEIFKHSGV